MNKRNYKKSARPDWVLLLLTVTMFISSCRKLVEAPLPSESIADENVYSTDATAIAVLNDIYVQMNNSNSNSGSFQSTQSINLLAGLSSDELGLHSGYGNTTLYYSYYANNLSQSPGNVSFGAEQWSRIYNLVFRANAVIEGVNSSSASTLTPAIKQQLLGEAKFLRAFFYFYLVNMYGDVPLALSTDPQINRTLNRTPKAQVYHQMISDLKEADEILYNDFPLVSSGRIIATTERVRPTKWAAKALLSRVYLYNKEWDKAEVQATDVISNSTLFGPLPGINNAFLKNSREAIWQLQPTDQFFNTFEARIFVIPPQQGPSSSNPVFLSKQLINSFEPSDQRKAIGNWIDTNIYTVTTIPLVRDTVTFCYKYKVFQQNTAITSTSGMTEYFMILRLGEQYLIRAEARAMQNNIAGARQDLLAIRDRAGLSQATLTANDQATLLVAIAHERQVELFCEGGHRWFDLKRTGKVDEVMNIATPLKSNGTVQWQPYKALYPLPLSDLIINGVPNPYLTQNPGY